MKTDDLAKSVYDASIARMQHKPVRVTPGGKLAMKRYYFAHAGPERGYEWIRRDGGKRFIYTNDGSDWQYKAQVSQRPKGWQATIRTLPFLTRSFDTMEEAKAHVEEMVSRLLNVGHDFYGPDLDVLPEGCDA